MDITQDTAHSYRSAVSGSTFVARHAGTQQANSATTESKTAITTNVSGSVALTPNRRLFIVRVNANEAINPNTDPTTASVIP